MFYIPPQPANLQILRQHALHLLFMPPAPTPSSSEAQAPVRNLFPFVHKPNTLERDRIVFPAGWDSWGKISVMRDGFDAKMCWEPDLESGEQETSEAGVKEAYATLVHDQGSRANCFNLTFLQSSLHRRSLRHYLHSIIPFQNKPSLPKIMTNIRRNQTESSRDIPKHY